MLWETNGIPGRQMMEEDTGMCAVHPTTAGRHFSFRPGSHSQSRRLLCDFPVIYFMIPFPFKAAATFQPYNMCTHTPFFSWKINQTSKFAARNSGTRKKKSVVVVIWLDDDVLFGSQLVRGWTVLIKMSVTSAPLIFPAMGWGGRGGGSKKVSKSGWPVKVSRQGREII